MEIGTSKPSDVIDNCNCSDYLPTLADMLNINEQGEFHLDDDEELIMVDVVKRRKETCTSFTIVLSRFFSSFRRRTNMIKKKKKKKQYDRDDDPVAVTEGVMRDEKVGLNSLQGNCSMNCPNEERRAEMTEEEASQSGCDSEKCRKEAVFNMGIGFGLIYLLAMSKSELTQMIELRKQMEILFQNGKRELDLHSKDTLSMPSLTNNTAAYTTIDVAESLNSNACFSFQNYTTSDVLACYERTARRDGVLNEDISREEECAEGLDLLEAEFEAEFENLQLRLDADLLLVHHQEEKIEVEDEEAGSEGILTASYEEVMNEKEAYTERDYGVHPQEVKIRLLELIQEKQEERIKELDAALEHAKQKLEEKEIEVSWWKETAQLLYPSEL